MLDTEVVQDIFDQVKQLHTRVVHAQRNVTEAVANIEVWSKVPLFERKEGKLDNLLYLEDRTERVQRRYELIEVTSALIIKLLEENYRLFFNLPEPKEPTPEEVMCFSA